MVLIMSIKKTEFPDYEIRPIDDLIPYARNSRLHSDKQIEKIANSIKEFGFINPVITDGQNGIIAGHGRVMAAKKVGFKELPCIEAAHLTDTQRRAYVLADNRIAEGSSWDHEMVFKELTALQEMDFDLAITDFDINQYSLDDDYFPIDDLDDEEKEPNKTDDGYVEFALVMPSEEKRRVAGILKKIKAEYDFKNQYQALIYLVDQYAENS